jgi:hypothetical protein
MYAPPMRPSLLPAVLAVSFLAAPSGAAVRPAERLAAPWLQEFYEQALRSKARAEPFGLCAGAQGLYAYGSEGDAAKASEQLSAGLGESLGSETLFLAVLEAANATLSRGQDERTKRGPVVAGAHDLAKTAELKRFVERAVADPALTDALLARAGEFSGPGAKRFYHVDALYMRRETPQSEPLQSLVRFLVVADQQAKQLLLVGDGECDF